MNIYLLGIILAIILYSISSIKYFLSSRDLIIKIGFLKIRFDLENLEKIYFKKFPALKDKALRLNINFYTDFKNIIVLQFKKVSITISPENPVAFIETLKAYKPDVEIE
ncbi:MAG: PH domain-containing protein [Candidatus Hydrothermales bacterium]